MNTSDNRKDHRVYIPAMRRTSFSKYIGHFLCFLLALIAIEGCKPAAEAPAAAPAATASAPEYTPEATVKDLMIATIDTAADAVWLSVTTTVDSKGISEVKPQNDEEWAKVRYGALTLAEAANLLMIPGRRVARPGEKSETPGVELEPEEMDQLIAKDRAAWVQRATALREAAVIALQAAEAKDANKIFEIGETIEHACENCHRQYWYPNEQVPDIPSAPASTP
jgi:hypothetical protein